MPTHIVAKSVDAAFTSAIAMILNEYFFGLQLYNLC